MVCSPGYGAGFVVVIFTEHPDPSPRLRAEVKLTRTHIILNNNIIFNFSPFYQHTPKYHTMFSVPPMLVVGCSSKTDTRCIFSTLFSYLPTSSLPIYPNFLPPQNSTLPPVPDKSHPWVVLPQQKPAKKYSIFLCPLISMVLDLAFSRDILNQTNRTISE